MSDATPLLQRLLRKGEAALLRGDARPASLPMTSASSAREYLSLASLDERERFHAQIALAERAGAITVLRDRHRGDGEQLLRVSVADLPALAACLGVELVASRVDAAARALQPLTGRFPVVAQVLEAWRNGRRVRGSGPEAADDLADAARAVAGCLDAPERDRLLRRESVRLFGDSKRLESLTPWLDLLASGELVAEGALDRPHVWAMLGLRREPQPLLLAGSGWLQLAQARLPLVRPWLGIPPEALHALETSARIVLSIENLASFHEAARLPDTGPCLLLYTGGMPSPAWRQAYVRILAGLAPGTQAYHWGDIDEGGFRIASVLAAAARDAGHRLRPWRMSPAMLPDDVAACARLPEPATLRAMRHYATRAGWQEVARELEGRPILLEQEALDPARDEAALPRPGPDGPDAPSGCSWSADA